MILIFLEIISRIIPIKIFSVTFVLWKCMSLWKTSPVTFYHTYLYLIMVMIQFSSVSQSCLTLCDPMNHSMPGLMSITNSRSLLKLISIKSVMPSNHLILCHPLLLLPLIPPSIRVFSNESTLCMRWSSTEASASASVLPVNTQNWSPLGWTGWISLQSKGLSRIFANATVQKH